MAVFEWRRYRTKHFGERWLPIAEVEIQAANGEFQPFAVQLDSGAVVSLLKRSVADVLGLSLERGRRIDMGGVGGGRVHAYVHELSARLWEGGELRIPFAIAEVEQVPNLLGRAGFFDVLQVDFDATLRESRITARWLAEDYHRIWRFVLETERHILARWEDKPLPGRGDEAASRFIRRGAQVLAAIAGLLKLHLDFECPALMRSLLEIAMQLEYLLGDPAARSRQYLDFEHVTKYKQLKAIIDTPTGIIARGLASSPNRLAGAPRLKREYDRVRADFQRGKGTWDAWYCMTVRGLAEAVGRLPEYQLWYRMFSAWAHADPFGTRAHRLVDDRAAFITSICYYGRMLLQVADAKQMILTDDQWRVLKECDHGVI